MLRQQRRRKADSKHSTKLKPQTSKRRQSTLKQVVAQKGNHFDAVVIGAGIGGASAALGLVTPSIASPPGSASLKHSKPVKVLVIDKENDFCFHSTGRSAAIYSEVYGSPSIRALSTATKPFYYTPTQTGLLSPEDGSTDNDLVFKRGTVWVATKKSQQDMHDMYESTKHLVPSLRKISLDEMYEMVPALKYPATNDAFEYDSDLAAIYGEDDGDYKPVAAMLEPDAADMDVNAIWASFVKVAKHNGASFVSSVELDNADYSPTTKWHLTLSNKIKQANGSVHIEPMEITTDLVVNASGAWADDINGKLGTTKRKIAPKQRTIIQFLPNEFAPKAGEADQIATFDQWPSVFDMHDRYYYKPDAGRVLASPCDEVDVEAADVQPDELTMAICVERMRHASFFNPSNIIHKWAGLRSFAPDREFVLGFDSGNPGSKFSNHHSKFGRDLMHISGLGGYGIQTAAGNSVVIAGLYHNNEFPQHILDMGIEPQAICPARPM